MSNIVKHIYLLDRRDGFRGDASFVEQVKNNKKIEIIYNVTIEKYNEENNRLKSITLSNGKNLDVSGVFIYVGYKPSTEFIPNELLDDNGYIKVNEKFETSIPHVYAIGDIIKKDLYQLVTAASDGAKVIKNID